MQHPFTLISLNQNIFAHCFSLIFSCLFITHIIIVIFNFIRLFIQFNLSAIRLTETTETTLVNIPEQKDIGFGMSAMGMLSMQQTQELKLPELLF